MALDLAQKIAVSVIIAAAGTHRASRAAKHTENSLDGPIAVERAPEPTSDNPSITDPKKNRELALRHGAIRA